MPDDLEDHRDGAASGASEATIEDYFSETRLFPPSEQFRAQAVIDDPEIYDRAAADWKGFWAEQAGALDWFRTWETVLEWDLPFARWFDGGTLNVSYNCLDRHVAAGHEDKVAFHWEGEPGDAKTVTYGQLLTDVSRFANVLRGLGVGRGDRVAIYMPMIPELPVAMLACTRIGAVHSVVFGGFSSDTLRDRILDAEARVVVTADGGWRRGSPVALKPNVDVAVEQSPCVEHVVVAQRIGEAGDRSIEMTTGRDHFWHELVSGEDAAAGGVPKETCEPEHMAAEDLLFLLYTSGTTAAPKGIMHTTGGYLTQVAFTHKAVFDLHPERDVYWCAADIGWVTGHSYIVYGPLANGATSVMYEGTPDFPDRDRWWSIVERYGVTILYTAPTAIRTFMKWGTEYPNRHDLTSLRVLGSVGEPINPEAWMWYSTHIGGGRCPVVDTWWQTETGGIMIAPLPGITTTKPGSATFPLPGIEAEVVDDHGVAGRARRRIPHPHPSVALDAPRHLRRPRALPRHLLEPLRGTLLRGRRRQDRRGRLPLAARAGRRRDERLGAPDLDHRGRVRTRRPPGGRRIGRGRRLRRDVRAGDRGLRDAAGRGRVAERRARPRAASHVAEKIGPIARPKTVIFTEELPKTRSGKIMRRLLRDVAEGRNLGDTTTLADPAVVEEIRRLAATSPTEE